MLFFGLVLVVALTGCDSNLRQKKQVEPKPVPEAPWKLLDRRCDSEPCDVYLRDENCCPTCTPQAAGVSFVNSMNAMCEQFLAEHDIHCPKLNCLVKTEQTVRCEHGIHLISQGKFPDPPRLCKLSPGYHVLDVNFDDECQDDADCVLLEQDQTCCPTCDGFPTTQKMADRIEPFCQDRTLNHVPCDRTSCGDSPKTKKLRCKNKVCEFAD